MTRSRTWRENELATKVRVEVEVSELENGWLEPSVIFWPDGRKWKVDRVVFQSVSCDNEYEGIRYTVMIGSAEKYIYRAGHEWYVMA